MHSMSSARYESCTYNLQAASSGASDLCGGQEQSPTEPTETQSLLTEAHMAELCFCDCVVTKGQESQIACPIPIPIPIAGVSWPS